MIFDAFSTKNTTKERGPLPKRKVCYVGRGRSKTPSTNEKCREVNKKHGPLMAPKELNLKFRVNTHLFAP